MNHATQEFISHMPVNVRLQENIKFYETQIDPSPNLWDR